VLLGAFVVRVVAQPAAWLTGWRVLPSFEAWHSGALSYAWLVTAQVTLVAWMTRTASRVTSGAEVPAPRLGGLLLAVAGLYAAAMCVRLVAGVTWLRGHWWFDAPLPTVFHLVLAAYLGVYAHYHALAGARGAREGG